MKENKFKILLQLFADGEGGEGGANGADGAGGTEGGAQPQTQPKPEAKYTDADLDRIIGKKFAEWKQKEEKKTTEGS